jgi:ABC-type bacteriocin/lantibiotic exporter with double-glycine peptidase domain
MTLHLRDVSFAYPGGGKKKDPLRGINLDIKPGQVIVVVGVNGSGKSTLTRILARLYDPSSGELLIDGRPSTEYSVADLRRATAVLSQDSYIFPLTLAENIGLGYPERSSDLELIKEAASEGGAAEFIQELEKGYQTMLSSFDSSFHINLGGDRQHPLWVMSDKMTKPMDISGGQRQRIVVYALISFFFGLLAYLITVLGRSCASSQERSS